MTVLFFFLCDKVQKSFVCLPTDFIINQQQSKIY